MLKTVVMTVMLLASLAFADSRILKVGLSNSDYAPFYFEKDGKITGAAAEVSETLATKLGYRLEYKRYPWKRVEHSLKNGVIDMLLIYFKTEKREKIAYYTDVPCLQETSDLFVKKGNSIAYDGTLMSLERYKIGNVKGYSHGKAYDNAANLDKRAFKNETKLIDMVLHERIDIGVGSKPVILYHAKQQGWEDQVAFLTPAIDVGLDYIVFSKAHPEAKKLVSDFSRELKAFKETPEYRAILEKYGF